MSSPFAQTVQSNSQFLPGGFVQRLKQSSDDETVEVLLVQGENPRGEPCYAYIAIVASLIRDFQLSLKIRTTNLEDYGVILASGNGEPDDKTNAYIRNKFLQS